MKRLSSLVILVIMAFCANGQTRLASIPENSTSMFYDLEWTSIEENIVKEKSPSGISVTTETSRIEQWNFAEYSKWVKPMDTDFHKRQYFSKDTLIIKAEVPNQSFSLYMHFYEFKVDTSSGRQRVINVNLYDSDMDLIESDIWGNMYIFRTAMSFPTSYSHTVNDGLPVKTPHIFIEIVNNASLSFNDSYVTVTGIELVELSQPIAFEKQGFEQYYIIQLLDSIHRSVDVLDSLSDRLKETGYFKIE